jgi:hypothetical protein
MTYEDKFVAFVDILGFSDLVRRSEEGGPGAPSVDYVLELTKKLGASKDRDRFAEYGPTTCPSAPHKAKNLNFQVTQISDCVVVSAEVSPAGLINLTHYCFGVSIELLILGHLIRGYITRGKIFHSDAQIIGTGYMRAYEGEQKVSIFQTNTAEGGTPFIEIDPAVCTYVSEQPDACVKMMFGRMTESDGQHTAISPFPALKKKPATIVDRNFDPRQWKLKVSAMRQNMLRLLSQLEQSEGSATVRDRAKIEHYKRKLLEIVSAKDAELAVLDSLSHPYPRRL